MTYLLSGIFTFVIFLYYGTALQCLDESGRPVDWYVLYKLPKIAGSKEYLVRLGLSYMYLTSETKNQEWIMSNLSINETRSMPALTLQPIYGNNSKAIIHALYNDDPPTAHVTLTYGHTKGVVAVDESSGFWLIHSAPNFPIEPVDAKTKRANKYMYPSTAARYGQSFLCISLPKGEINKLGIQLTFNKPKIYSSNLPEKLKDTYQYLTKALQGSYVKQAPWNNKLSLVSLKGVQFTSYAKASGFGKDLYSDWVAPDLASDLQVETWSNGEGDLPSDCKDKYHVMDVSNLAVKVNSSSQGISFKNSQDHSKWAITANADNPIVCIGDINRMTAQFKRGGGTVCLKDENVWKRFSKLISDVRPCPAA